MCFFSDHLVLVISVNASNCAFYCALNTVVESDWLYCSLNQHRRCQLVTDEEIHSLSGALGPADLYDIAVELNVDSTEFEQYRSSELQSVSAQAYKLLSEWTVNEGGSATIATFVQRKRNAGIADDIIKSAVLHSS